MIVSRALELLLALRYLHRFCRSLLPGWRDLGFRLLSRRLRLDGLARIPKFATEDESVVPFFRGHAALASDEVCHLCQQAIRCDVHRYKLEATVWFVIEEDRAGILRLSGVGPPDEDPGGLLDDDGITPRDQRAEGLRELTIETSDPDVLILDPQERMALVNRTLELLFALRYLHFFCQGFLLLPEMSDVHPHPTQGICNVNNLKNSYKKA